MTYFTLLFFCLSEGDGKYCPIALCRLGSSTWGACQDDVFESETSRGPANLGPARRIAEAPFLIITGVWDIWQGKSILRGFFFLLNTYKTKR